MYNIVRPPFEKDFQEMAPDELKSYFEWFLEIIPQRMKELADEVRRTPGFEGWSPDCSPASLDALGQWYAGQIERRPTTPQEMAQIREAVRGDIPGFEPPAEQLTHRTYSLAFDVGTYLSQVFMKNCPGLSWQQVREDKELNNYGQPVLVGLGPRPCSPLLLATVLAHGLAKKRKKPGRLRELYDIWSRKKRPLDLMDCRRDMQSILPHAITGAVVIFGVRLVQQYLHDRKRATVEAVDGVARLRYGPVFRWVSAALLVVPSAGFSAVAWANPPQTTGETLAWLGLQAGFLLLGVPLVLEAFGVRHQVSKEGLLYRTPWSRERMIPWEEVRSIGWNEAARWWVLTTSDGARARLPELLDGLETFFEFARCYAPIEPSFRKLARPPTGGTARRGAACAPLRCSLRPVDPGRRHAILGRRRPAEARPPCRKRPATPGAGE